VLVFRSRRLDCLALGTVQLPAGWSLARRLARLGLEIGRLVRLHRPDGVAVEQAIYAQNVRTALILGQARGVVLGAAALEGAEVFEYSPREVKRAVTGNGAASKTQVQGMMRRLLGLSRMPGSDEADAAALAFCHLRRDAGRTSATPSTTVILRRGRKSSRWTARDVERLLAAGRAR